MELSGVASRNIPCLPRGVGTGSHRTRTRFRLRSQQRGGFCGVSMGFRENGHVRYYSGEPRCGSRKVDKAVEKKGKKNVKFVKGLYKELSMFSQMGLGIDSGSDMLGELQEKRISEAAEVILTRLKQLKLEKKELKKMRKQEKARLKAERMKHTRDSDSSSSSSSSSESSDSETDEVIDMNRLRMGSQPVEKTQPIPSLSELSTPASNTSNEAGRRKIEVCMAGKCRKSGGSALLDELQRAVRIDGAVVGCKCMGKCRDGPNVRICNGPGVQRESEGYSSASVSPPPLNPLCIGVGLEDVGVIVANFLGTEQGGLDVGLQST
ncbi:hypothetical protein SAY87_023799 [Trapa incisa]|uniref:Diacylglycerol O-acyltransferase 3, cytosolic n=1 Tax=Trapa incisa TaxID=236973 RepID=A0AAN7L430_9MYRT|nr:hypothetical protein SAY87_023799 [Trapa incisa]